VALAFVFPIQGSQSDAQNRTEEVLPTCDQTRGLFLVQLQVDEAKTIDNVAARIAILIEAAETLWSFQQDTARAIFTQAYEVAQKNFQDKSDTLGKEKPLRGPIDDLRFAVIQAISRHDSRWARLLAKGAAEEAQRDAESKAEEAKREAQKAGSSAKQPVNMGDKFLSLSFSMLSVDQRSAVDLARISLRYPASYVLGQFLFKLAGSDQEAGDQLYREAIRAYSNSGIRNLLLLSAYPFGLKRIVIGAESVYVTVPPSFVPNASLQQIFLDALFHRAEMCLDTSTGIAASPGRTSEPAQVYLALSMLEPLIAEQQPTLLENAMRLRVAIGSVLYPEVRQASDSTARMQLGTEDTFASYVEKAERAVGSDKRDSFLVLGILRASDDESLEHLRDLAQKVSDSKIRQQVLNWLYFKRAQKAIKEKTLYDAKALAEKVEQLDLRAYLSYEIATESLKRVKDVAQAREVLDAVVAAALKTDNSNEKARTLLGAAHLYSGIDPLRAFEVMADAVKTINRIASVDLSDTGLMQRIEGPQFASYARYEVAGFSLEKAFRELSTSDFDRALLSAKTLEDKSFRSRAIIAIVASCLESARKPEKSDIRVPRDK